MLKKLLKSTAALGLYFFYRPFICLLGPRYGLAFSRIVGLLNYCLLLNRNNSVSSRVQSILPLIRPDISVSKTIRDYYLLKHLFFAESYLLGTQQSKMQILKRYAAHIHGRDILDHSLQKGNGVIILFYHYGTAPFIVSVLQQLGYDAYEHVRVNISHQKGSFGWASRLSQKKELERVHSAVGDKAILNEPYISFSKMIRLLKENKIVGVNGDGMTGENFVQVPFLKYTMLFPSGPALLSAHSGAPIIPAFAIPDGGLFNRRIILHPAVAFEPEKKEPEKAVVASCSKVLEQYIHDYPWLWWTWRRLDMQYGSEQEIVLTARFVR